MFLWMLLPYVMAEETTITSNTTVEKTVGDWFLAFRAQSRNNLSVVQAYMSSSGTDELNALRTWVKVELYKNGKPVAFVTFNAEGADVTNWFNQRRIISSSWTDVTSTRDYNYFGFFGYKNQYGDRRLFINYRHLGGCSKYNGWMMVIEGPGQCGFDYQDKYPAFLYSLYSTIASVEQNMGKADVLAIYLDF